jgi:uncharacterized protein
MEVLSRDDCLRLLDSQAIGRVVVTIDYIPVAFPVNIIPSGGDVFFTSAPGGKLEKAINKGIMSIEVDHWSPMNHEGWSVLVTGRSELVTDHAVSQRVKGSLEAWAPGPHDNVVRVPMTFISGRRLTRAVKQSYPGGQ